METEDIRQLLEANLKLAKENNRMLRKMSRDAFFGKLFKLLYFLIIIGAGYYAYVTYLKPYLEEVMATYQQIQETGATIKEKADSLPESVQQLLN